MTGFMVLTLGSLLVWVWGGDWRLLTTTVVLGLVIVLVAGVAATAPDRGGRRG